MSHHLVDANHLFWLQWRREYCHLEIVQLLIIQSTVLQSTYDLRNGNKGELL